MLLARSSLEPSDSAAKSEHNKTIIILSTCSLLTSWEKIRGGLNRFPCCVLLASFSHGTNEDPSTDKLSRAIN